MFSKACEYAIKATIFIAGQSMQNKKTGQKAIAKAIDGPEAFTAKTLQKLTRNKVVSADKGPNGGFYLTKDQLQNICLKHIVEVIDGNSLFENCGLGLNKCNDKKPCPVHNKFKLVKEGILVMLESTTVQFMAIQMKKGKTFLKI
ncbi:MAG: Rrf2 family transcriptional regulator [Chitinophagaceae bacterium]|nr:Rrf2 family transcriptional regulator [Chitinophagaceae bacterium]MBK8775048.1 Rrf2 family transcriptional regulator [Chitinophagaceae bacterium]